MSQQLHLKLMAVALFAAALLLLLLGGQAVPPVEASVLAIAPTPIKSIAPVSATRVLHAAMPTSNAQAERCETTPIQGSHTARAEWEARQGALEDVADICPAGQVSPTEMKCSVVDAAHGIEGNPAQRCVQQAICTLCGEKLARRRELR